MHEEKLNNVPQKDLAKNVAGFAADGAKSIQCKKLSNGKWSIVAMLPGSGG